MAAVLLFEPVRATFAVGQIDVVLALPLVIGVRLALRHPQDPRASGAAAALAVLAAIKPQMAGPTAVMLLIVLVRRHPRAALGGAAAVGGAGLVACAVLAPTAHWAQWPAAVLSKPDPIFVPVRATCLALGIVVAAVALQRLVVLLRCSVSDQERLVLLVAWAAAVTGLGAAVAVWQGPWLLLLLLPLAVAGRNFTAANGVISLATSARQQVAMGILAGGAPGALSNLFSRHGASPGVFTALWLVVVTAAAAGLLGLMPPLGAAVAAMTAVAFAVAPFGAGINGVKVLAVVLVCLLLLHSCHPSIERGDVVARDDSVVVAVSAVLDARSPGGAPLLT